ncbi:hypothetical protein CDAR_46021 [Caerostris darwini]|uniref:Uncharacterized protein n=1 Tax=Caerostris darwini TaxID=1538125 RepID=A0AAV4M793_9ARAC|nr:hypothetical protein CDAR_46021 [Caerostris darwini]
MSHSLMRQGSAWCCSGFKIHSRSRCCGCDRSRRTGKTHRLQILSVGISGFSSGCCFTNEERGVPANTISASRQHGVHAQSKLVLDHGAFWWAGDAGKDTNSTFLILLVFTTAALFTRCLGSSRVGGSGACSRSGLSVSQGQAVLCLSPKSAVICCTL